MSWAGRSLLLLREQRSLLMSVGSGNMQARWNHVIPDITYNGSGQEERWREFVCLVKSQLELSGHGIDCLKYGRDLVSYAGKNDWIGDGNWYLVTSAAIIY